MSAWDHVCCAWYGVQARWSALGHLLRGHDLHWRFKPDPWVGCFGDISCEKCPDTDGAGLAIWCRYFHPWHWCSMRLCGWLGHQEARESQRWSGEGEPGDNANMVGTGDWYCSRCMADVEPPA